MVQYCQSPTSQAKFSSTLSPARGSTFGSSTSSLSKVFRVGSVRLVPIVSIFNVTSEEAVTGYTTDPFDPFGYGTAESWQNPRRWEVGFRVEF